MLHDLAGVIAIAFFVSLIVCRAMIAAGPLDAPVEARKRHAAPTPTSGGVGIGAGFAAGMVALSLFSTTWRHEVSHQGVLLLWICALYAYPLLLIGFVDDARHLSAKFKFAAYAAVSLAGAWSFGVVEALPLGALTLPLPFAVGLFGTALWIFTLVNAVNFMDGANGLAMGCLAVGLIALAAVALDGGAVSAAAAGLCATGALLGFLVWNFPAGRLFAGDSGALFSGAIAAFGALIVIERMGVSPFVPPILFFPLLADVLLTLLYRARRGRSLLVAHTEHLYQLAAAAGWSQVQVALTYWGAMAACGLVAVLSARDPTGAAPAAALAALVGLALALDIYARRQARARGVLTP